MSISVLRAATRSSPLAVTQTCFVLGLIEKNAPETSVEIMRMSTPADQHTKPLHTIGGKGLFVHPLEQSLISGETDIAIHSLKDVPSTLSAEFSLLIVESRANPYDVLIAQQPPARLETLPPNSVLGTSSPRRAAHIRHFFPQLQVKPLRGNVQSRLDKLPQMDGILLAHAGLERLRLNHYIHQVLSPEIMLPSPGQGLLAIEFLTSRSDIAALLSPLQSQKTLAVANAERQCCQLLGADCHSPVAALATWEDSHTLQLHARVFDPSGENRLDAIHTAQSEQEIKVLGQEVARDLLQQGAQKLLSLPPLET